MKIHKKHWLAAAGWALSLGLVCSTPAQAQYQIDLSKQKLAIIDPAFYIKEVIDLRPVASPIGFVQTGINNNRTPAELAGGLTNGLHMWLPHGAEAAANARPLIMRVYELNVYEVTGGMSERSYATLDVDFLAPLTDSTYALVLRHIDHQDRAGLDVTNQHDDNITDCLRRALTKLQQVSWQKGEGLPVVPRQQLAYLDGQPLAKYRAPIVMAAYPKRGIYRNFSQFRSNAPESDSGFVYESFTNGRAQLYRQEGALRLPVNQVWGFSDGKFSYMLVGNQYRQLVPKGPDYTFEGPGQADAASVVAGGLLFGMVGAAVASAASNGKETYVLRTGTGTIMPESALPARNEVLEKEATIILYRRGGSKTQPLTVRLQDQPAPALRPGEYVTLQWRDKTKGAVLTVDGVAGATMTLTPSFSATNYVELRVKDGGAEVSLYTVSAEEGAFQVRKSKEVQPKEKGFFD